MTEQEATKKWCPMVRKFGTAGGDYIPSICPPSAMSYNRTRAESCKCVASACMMWRWSQEVGLCDGDTENAHGYCGLGGRP